MPLEHSTEQTFVRRGEERGALVLKLVPLGRAGFPDRTCIARPGRVAFAELKQVGERPGSLQRWWLRTLRRLGFKAEVVRTVEDVDRFFDEWLG